MILKRITVLLTFLFFVLSSPHFIFAQNVLFYDDFENTDLYSRWNYFSGNWTQQLFNNSTWLSVVSPEFSDSELQAGNSSWNNYSLEFDLFRVSGEDVNIFFRIQDGRYLHLEGHNLPIAYGLHIKKELVILQKFTLLSGQELETYFPNIPYYDLTQSKIKISLVNNIISIYVDDMINPVIQYTDNNQPYFNGGIALASITGSSGLNAKFDNVKVTLLPVETPTATPVVTATPTFSPSPTATPTSLPTTIPTASPIPTMVPTMSPTPNSLVLNVPNLKQYSEPWKNKFYAHTQTTIEQFGCALTSAAMVLQYHGHNILPDELNSWLNNQPDGYIRSNLINWLAVSRYTKINDSFFSPTLEYKRIDPTNTNLDNELNNNRPVILKENGHFIVAKGKVSDTYLINDPGYADRNDLSSYNNSYLAINSYKPTHSDLSYMMFVTDPDVNLEVKSSTGNQVFTNSYIEDPITNLLNPNEKIGEKVKITFFEKPVSDNYSLKISGSKGEYHLDSYLYDVNGKVVQNNFAGYLRGNDSDTFKIMYNNKKNKIKNKKLEIKFWLKHFVKFFDNNK